jgi:hypothetical protein
MIFLAEFSQASSELPGSLTLKKMEALAGVLQNMVMQVFDAAMPEGLCETFQLFGIDITDSPKRIGRRGSDSLTPSLIAGLKIISTSVSTSAKRVLIRLWCFEFASCSSMKVPMHAEATDEALTRFQKSGLRLCRAAVKNGDHSVPASPHTQFTHAAAKGLRGRTLGICL